MLFPQLPIPVPVPVPIPVPVLDPALRRSIPSQVIMRPDHLPSRMLTDVFLGPRFFIARVVRWYNGHPQFIPSFHPCQFQCRSRPCYRSTARADSVVGTRSMPYGVVVDRYDPVRAEAPYSPDSLTVKKSSPCSDLRRPTFCKGHAVHGCPIPASTLPNNLRGNDRCGGCRSL